MPPITIRQREAQSLFGNDVMICVILSIVYMDPRSLNTIL
jgi:hypothetical protein